jgi:hypothetical protein
MSIEIRKANIEDVEGIVEVLQKAVIFGYPAVKYHRAIKRRFAEVNYY